MAKISIIGAGAVGSTTAMRIAESSLAEVVLVDIVGGLAEAKALDIASALPITGGEKAIRGTDNYELITGSQVVVVTAGLTRKPGMSREDLLDKNAEIVKAAVKNIVRFCPQSIIIMVTNPLDVMSYLAFKFSGFEARRVIGMGGVLDSARFRTLIARELGVSPSGVKAMVIGAHGEPMLPLARLASVSGRALEKLVSPEVIKRIVNETCGFGARIVSLQGTGSACFGPSASITAMAECILKDKKEIVAASTYLSGQYGLKDIYAGVPVRLGKEGIEEIIELGLNEDEKNKFRKSVESIRQSVQKIKLQ